MKSIEAKQQEIIAEFQEFSDWEDKYEFMIELGMDLPPLAPEHKVEAKRIVGCQSNVWLNPRYDAESHLMFYEADSEALIVKGLVSMLIEVLSGQPPEEIVSARLEFLSQIGLDKHLSSTRSNGLAAMVQKMKQYAAEKLHPLEKDQ